MKKIVYILFVFFLLTVSIYTIDIRDVFEKIGTPISLEVSNINKKEGNVRIVIKENLDSIYRERVNLYSKSLKIYYGKNFNNIKEAKDIKLKSNSTMFKNNNIVKIVSDNQININDNSNGYKGSFYIYNTKSGLVLVNEVKMCDYISAVISSEMGESFPIEALKAQAICARTYILNSKSREYDKFNANADDTISFQVYNKIVPGEKCIKAAIETANMVMKSNGKLINAYYFSTSCGLTTDYKIWGNKKIEYLTGCCVSNNNINIKNEKKYKEFIMNKVECYESDYPFFRWNTYLSKEQIENSIYQKINEDIGELKSVKIEKRGCGGIASQILIKGDKKEVLLTNQNEIRKILISKFCKINLNDGTVRTNMEMLPSAFIVIENEKDGIKIYGGGFGHGSGMSQNAAKEMANMGFKYDEILNKFYANIELTIF